MAEAFSISIKSGPRGLHRPTLSTPTNHNPPKQPIQQATIVKNLPMSSTKHMGKIIDFHCGQMRLLNACFEARDEENKQKRL
mmetsp:Transcript_30877/g.53678  ORF Transcript_30877/g.53678 Transcript_30877/m.53678 type:complete len:82 (-) Transcript_30877:9-254(-)